MVANQPIIASVLIVDDDPVSRLVLRHMLALEGLDVVEAESADAARDVLGQHTVDLIICDYLMPGSSGLDLLESLPATHAPFVLLTGELRQDDLDDHRIEGVCAYLTKPVGTNELRTAIEAVLDPAAASPVPQSAAASPLPQSAAASASTSSSS